MSVLGDVSSERCELGHQFHVHFARKTSRSCALVRFVSNEGRFLSKKCSCLQRADVGFSLLVSASVLFFFFFRGYSLWLKNTRDLRQMSSIHTHVVHVASPFSLASGWPKVVNELYRRIGRPFLS